MPAHCRHTSKLIFFLVVLCLIPMRIVVAEEPAPFILLASTVPDTGIWVGQRVIYQVDVLGRDGWAKIQRMPDFQASGLIIVPFESQGTRLNETIDGESYTGQRYQLSLFPQRDGRISLPSATVNIEISRWGSQAGKQVLQGTIPPVNFTAKFPPGGRKLQGLISTGKLTAEQLWEPDVVNVTVGDAIQRRINLEAEDVSAMAFSPISFSGSDAVDVYPQTPIVKDHYDRGTLIGRRSETASYIFKNHGNVVLPSITITWWDLQNNKLRETVLPSRHIEIAPSSTVQGLGLDAEMPSNRQKWIYPGAVTVCLIVLAGLFHKHIRLRWHIWQRERNVSEKFFFRRFVKAARSGTPADTMNALMHWLDRIHKSDKAARLDQFLAAYSDSKVVKESERLLQAIESKTQVHWDSRLLIKGITKSRKKWLAQQRKSTTAHQRLPRLNPIRMGPKSNSAILSPVIDCQR